MKLLTLFIVVILFASCTKSIVEAPEVNEKANKSETLMVSPEFVKGIDNDRLIGR